MNHESVISQVHAALDGALKAGGSFEQIAARCEVAIGALPFTNDEVVEHCLWGLTEGIADAQPTRLQAAQRFYRWNVDLLRQTVYDAYRDVTPGEVDRLTAKLWDRLESYRGPKTEFEVMAWCVRYLRREAEALRRFHQLQSDHRRVVLEGLWSVLRATSDLMDDGTLDELEALVWEWVYTDTASPLYTDGDASASTRLYGQARWFARAWKTQRLRDKARMRSIESLAEKPYPTGAKKPNADQSAARMRFDKSDF
jgi:hypothetical protein